MRKGLIGFALFLFGIALPRHRPPITRRPANGPARPGRGGHGRREAERAMDFMKSHETKSPPQRDFSTRNVNWQAPRVDADGAGGSNGLIVRRGYIVAEFGETLRPDPTYSVAKSMFATVAGIAIIAV